MLITSGARRTSSSVPASVSCRHRSGCTCRLSRARTASCSTWPRSRTRPRRSTRFSVISRGRCSQRCTCVSTRAEALCPRPPSVFEDDLVTVFRSLQRRECNERLLVLTAVGVEAVITAVAGEFLLQVAPRDAGYAARHLLQYEAENRPPPPP